MTPDYHIAALIAVRDGRVLLCRKSHTTALLILPGGSMEAGESPVECLERELQEELADIHANGFEFIGSYDHEAAVAGRTIRVELYSGELLGDPRPQAEIAEVVWFGEYDDRAQLAPSLVHAIFPDLIARRIIPWQR